LLWLLYAKLGLIPKLIGKLVTFIVSADGVTELKDRLAETFNSVIRSVKSFS